jgi:ABC-type multidrug transport system fused ATPase/permease subunit
MKLFEKRVKQNTTYAVHVQKASNSFLFDILKNKITVRSFQKKDYFNNKLLDKEQHLLKANLKKHLWSNGLFEFIWTSSKIMEYVALYGFGGYLVFKGYSELSTIFAFVFIVEQIVSGLNTLASGINGKSTSYALIDSIEEILKKTQVENKESLNILHDNFIIKAENISFAFGEKKILENISFRIDEKEKIMITGPNGQGKSTLLNIISGLLCPTSGKLSYGTQDITVVNLNSISECYAYISQNNILDGNIFENIALNRKYNIEKCNIILENLHLNEKKESKPITLSQGEKQRVNISRALYKNDVCLILCDEIFLILIKIT